MAPCGCEMEYGPDELPRIGQRCDDLWELMEELGGALAGNRLAYQEKKAQYAGHIRAAWEWAKEQRP